MPAENDWGAVTRGLREERAALQAALRAARTGATTAAMGTDAAVAEQARQRERLAAVEATHPAKERRLERAQARLAAAQRAVSELDAQTERDAAEATELHVVAEASQQIAGSLLARCEAAEAEAAALAQSVRQLSVGERLADTERRHQDSLVQSEQLEAQAVEMRREVGIARYMQTLYWERATKAGAAEADSGGALAGGGGAAGGIAVTEQQVDSIRAMLEIDDGR
jgi:hypothetical protein